jgi:predicted ester cyclase
MSERNKTASRRFLDEVWNKGNIDFIDEALDANYVNHSAPPGLSSDREGFKQFVNLYRGAFPDVQMTVEDIIAEGDTVVTRFTSRGTHDGDFMGAGKKVTVTGITIIRYAGDKAVEAWSEFDQAGMLMQIGAIPAPAGA